MDLMNAIKLYFHEATCYDEIMPFVKFEQF